MKKLAFLFACCLPLTACNTVLSNLPGVYTLDIEQGNIVDQSMVDQLRPNMTKRQVLYIMGSPMLADAFHERRWDYIYSDQPGGEERVQKRVSLFFSGDNLMGVQGDFRPTAAPIVKESVETSVELPKRDLDRSMWEKVGSLFGNEPNTLPRRTGDGASAKSPSPDAEQPTEKSPASTEPAPQKP